MTMFEPDECLNSIDSTNSYLKNSNAAHAKNFYTVRALIQTAGKGRHGRIWHTGENNLAFSFAFHWQSKIEVSAITIFAGLALRKALSEITGACILLKWPNDVTFQGKKIGGILTEFDQSHGKNTIIFGIGVNINKTNIPDKLCEITGCINEITQNDVAPEILLDAIMVQMKVYLPKYSIPIEKEFLQEFSQYCDKDANEVSIMQEGIILKKKYQINGINDRGFLLVNNSDQTSEMINAHELEYR